MHSRYHNESSSIERQIRQASTAMRRDDWRLHLLAKRDEALDEQDYQNALTMDEIVLRRWAEEKYDK